MKQKFHSTVWCVVVLAAGLSLSGCSSISQMSTTISNLNPFQQQTEETPPVTAPANEGTPAPSASIRVEAKPPAKPPAQGGRRQEVKVNVGDNKQCTTFCALPVRKPPAAQ